jgi:hypothetical protein
MRQAHPAGERLFVDYAGQTVELFDGRTGEVRAAQVFVAVMGASSYTYAEASWTQTLPDWIGSPVRAIAFIGGVPAQLVPDNPKVGVTPPTGTSRVSTAPISTWRPITARRSCRRGRDAHATRRKSRSACWWSSAGSWRASETAVSSRSAS